MTSNTFIINDYYELLALHRALLEAKFCDKPNDHDVSASPIVAELHKRLIRSLIDVEMDKKGESAKSEWNDWLKIDATRREWKVGLQRARSELLWEKWNAEEKKKYVYDLLSPFKLNEKLIESFIAQV